VVGHLVAAPCLLVAFGGDLGASRGCRHPGHRPLPPAGLGLLMCAQPGGIGGWICRLLAVGESLIAVGDTLVGV
jgi:hypothetical protein